MGRKSFSKQLLATLATLFAAATILYSALLMHDTRWQLPVRLGFDNQYREAEHCELVESVQSGSAVASVGLIAGDRIVEINGRRIENAFSLRDVWALHHPGDAVELTIERANVSALIVIKVELRAPRPSSKEESVAQDVGRDIANTYPVGFLVVGLAVLFLRLEDPNAWLLAARGWKAGTIDCYYHRAGIIRQVGVLGGGGPACCGRPPDPLHRRRHGSGERRRGAIWRVPSY